MVRSKVGARAHKIREIRVDRGQEGICARGKGKSVYVGRQRVSMHGIGGKARCKKTNGRGLMCATQHVNSDEEQEHVTMQVGVHNST